jgi:hypothetical protein
MARRIAAVTAASSSSGRSIIGTVPDIDWPMTGARCVTPSAA